MLGEKLYEDQKYLKKEHPCVAAMAQMDMKDEERLLTRLAGFWLETRSGSLGVHWVNGRRAHATAKVRQLLLANPGWATNATDRELYGAWLSATEADRWSPEHFDSWAEEDAKAGQGGARSLPKYRIKEELSSKTCKETAAPALQHAKGETLLRPKSGAAPADWATASTGKGSWPSVRTAPLELQPPPPRRAPQCFPAPQP